MAATTVAEHLAWCKQRALAELDAGSEVNAVASMVSDLGKHPETEHLTSLALLATAAPGGVRGWIEGFAG